MNRSFKQVAVLIDPGTAWGRGLIRGIVQYARQKNDWQFTAESTSPPVGRTLSPQWRGDGVIGRLSHKPHADMMRQLGVPAVNLAATDPKEIPIPGVFTDYRHVGQMAAEHLIDCGLNHFAVAGYNPGTFVDQCSLHFESRVRENDSDATCHRLHIATADSACEREIEAQLATLPRPIGIVAHNDVIGRLVIQAAVRTGLRVPEEVAVIGITNDDTICDMCHPPLSSVALSTERQGYLGAELLDRLMNGHAPPNEPILVEPQGVVARQSTDVLCIVDEDVSQAVQFIRRHATDPIRVEDVLREVPVSRRSLETRFTRHLGRGIAAEIRRLQVQHARQLLADTDMPMPAVAKAAGFSTPQYFAHAFRRAMDMTPQQYRMRHRCW